MCAASIQGGTTAEPWSARTQYARKGGRKRPRYQSQNGASCGFVFFSSSNRRDGCWPSCSQDSTWGEGSFRFLLLSLFLAAAVSTIPTFISIFFLFSAQTSFRREAERRQDQPPINAGCGHEAFHVAHSYYDASVPACTRFFHCFMTYSTFQRFSITRALVLTQSKEVWYIAEI
jgi:hypothetical protein